MKKFTLTDEPKQEVKILFEDTVITIEFRFNPTIKIWTMNITYKDEDLINGKSITLGVFILRELNMPFDLILIDNQKLDIDPFKLNDFSSGRLDLFLIERDELKNYRGYDVI